MRYLRAWTCVAFARINTLSARPRGAGPILGRRIVQVSVYTSRVRQDETEFFGFFFQNGSSSGTPPLAGRKHLTCAI